MDLVRVAARVVTDDKGVLVTFFNADGDYLNVRRADRAQALTAAHAQVEKRFTDMLDARLTPRTRSAIPLPKIPKCDVAPNDSSAMWFELTDKLSARLREHWGEPAVTVSQDGATVSAAPAGA